MNDFITSESIKGKEIPALGETQIQIITYNAHTVKEIVVKELHECFAHRESKDVLWINVEGLENKAVIEEITHVFEAHELLLEDILHTDIRPKIDFDEHQIFVTLKMLKYNTFKKEMESEQLSLLMGNNYVISFQEEAQSDVFQEVRNKIRSKKHQFIHARADFLFYALIDSIVDHYFLILEKIGDEVEELEQEIIDDNASNALKRLYFLKRELIFIRRSVWPLREIISALEREDTKLISKETRKYIHDIYDHTIQIIDAVESMRDVMSGLLDIYMSTISNRMNSVMKTLTIISTIFMPLTFVAGIYGMNFDNMPELHWRYGYFEVLGIMFLISLGMIFYFRKRKWL